MSNRKYAFIDEFGAFGYDFGNLGCTSHFLISAVIVDESNLSFVSERVESIRKRYFQQGEMKSSKIGKKHKRRISILNELKQRLLQMKLEVMITFNLLQRMLGRRRFLLVYSTIACLGSRIVNIALLYKLLILYVVLLHIIMI